MRLPEGELREDGASHESPVVGGGPRVVHKGRRGGFSDWEGEKGKEEGIR